MKKIIIILLLLTGSFFTGCENNPGEIIPYVRVDINLHLLSPPVVFLGDGESTMLNGGYNGIILYRERDLSYQAYDRTCTLWPDHSAAVVPDSIFEGVFECPECGSQYLLVNDGQVSHGPAVYPLVQYRTSITGDYLHIYN